MARYKTTDKEQDNLFISLKLSEQIIPGTLAHTIETVIDKKIDITEIEQRYKNDQTGRPAYDPRVLLKLILFAYSNGIISSRKIQEFSQTNTTAMALSENQSPNFTVIADFICGLANEITDVFTGVLLVASELA